jgi:methylene-tetrahydromethanopterin dehydrogenase
MVTPLKAMSPFDVNMAVDAGYDVVVPYTGVTTDDITGLVQDAIFSRPPGTVRQAMFFAGKDPSLALDMMAKAKAALVPPFVMSLFGDPAGSFTTAAAMVAGIDKTLRERKGRSLKGTKVAVYGATGPLGYSVAVISALEGADVSIVGYDGIKRVTEKAAEIKTRFGVDVTPVDGSDESKKEAIAAGAEVIAACGRAGVQILSKAQLELAKGLLIAIDANAVPPVGLEGVDAFANGVELTSHGAVGIGSLAMGDVKYKTESGLFGQMIATTEPLQLAIHEAYVLARQING